MPQRVYCLWCPGWNAYKVGCTVRDIQKRVKELQTGNPKTIEIACVATVHHALTAEKAIHDRLAKYRISDGEFFSCELETIRNLFKEFGDLEGEEPAEKVLGHRYIDDMLKFEIKWEGCKKTTWEPYENISDLPMIKKYKRANRL